MSSFHKFLSVIATDVVALQEQFDQAFEKECDRILPHIQAVAPAGDLLTEVLFPQRMVVNRQAFSCELKLEIEKSHGFALNCQVIPVQFRCLSMEQSLHEQSFQISIQQVPIQQNPFTIHT